MAWRVLRGGRVYGTPESMGDAPYIETPRLLLTWPTAAQIDSFYGAITGSAIFDSVVWDGPAGPEDLHDFWRRSRRQNPADVACAVSLAIIERATDHYVGGVSLRPVAEDPAFADIGYALDAAVHGRGYATEAVGALVDEAFANRQAERIFARVFVGNVASRRVLEKLGFRNEGTLRRAVLKHGDYLDEWMMAITRPDWEAHVFARE